MRNNRSLISGDRFVLLAAFVAVADTLNFAEAAKRLHLTSSTLSRRVKKLEQELGIQLLRRTTRQVNLTEQGRRYHQHCVQVLALLQDGDDQLQESEGAATGTLVVAAPSSYARTVLSPLLPEFMRAQPKVNVELRCSDRYVDLVEQNIDVAVRIGDLEDSTLVGRKLDNNRRRLVAAPKYLAQLGQPNSPQDLQQHQCLHFSHLSAGRVWSLYKGKNKSRVAVSPYLICDDASVLLDAAIAGLGIAILADFLCLGAVAKGQLTPVLSDWTLPPSEIYALYPKADFIPAKTRTFIDFLVQRINTKHPTGDD
ncbi:LysR family transcriptional regulator [Halioxenophilus aromaticivorans]|uniref:LysR family transcriptional regulator n=1 Tax=Halioxenophilus aromaticivorans TaxID=1306992 RepID=A0AAV3U376_9ALTE